MGRGFPSRKNTQYKGQEVQEDGVSVLELKESPLGRAADGRGESGAGNSGFWEGPGRPRRRGWILFPRAIGSYGKV